MLRRTGLCLGLVLLAACTSEERDPAPGTVFPSSGGSGGTAGWAGSGGTALDSGADGDAGDAGGQPSDAGEDGSTDAAGDTPDPHIECVVDPIPSTSQGYCVTVDDEGYQCDPVTSFPCDVAGGEVCDFDGERFRCLPPPDFDHAAPCELCGDPYPERCVSGFTCLGLDGRCTRYCCDSYQCAFGELCVMQPPTSVGICQAMSDEILAGFVGTPHVGDAGVANYAAECNPPADPGEGSCVTVGSATFECNPVTNAGCGVGETCDAVGEKWVCVSGTHDSGICEACTPTSCVAGATCIPSLGCLKYCCSHEDCTPGVCHSYPGLGGLGTCREPMGPDAGT
jgi:hypothetical protein